MNAQKIKNRDDFLALFPAEPRRKAGTGWLVICPAHNDKNPSLLVTTSKNPDFIADWTCQAGCKREAILTAKGLTWDDVRRNSHKPSGVVRRQEYPIRNVSGELIATHIRLEYDNGEKSFLWERNGVSGLGGMKVADLPLFNSEKISKHPGNDQCVICEGEKPAAALENLGILSLGTVTGASSAPSVEALRPVAKRSGPVYLWADNDTPGKSHMEKIASRLQALGKPCKVINWVEAPEKGDAADFVAAGGTLFELERLVSEAPEWKPPQDKVEIGFRLTKLSDLLQEPDEDIAYLWENTLIKGGLSILVAKPKVGKSTLARNLALKVARGDTEFLGRAITASGAVVYLGLEEKRSEVKKHFERMGVTEDLPIFIHVGSAPEKAIEELCKAVMDNKAVLAIVDPFQRLVRSPDLNDYSSVSLALEPLMQIARDTGCHILLIHHANKGISRESGDSILGSTAIYGSMDCALIMKRSESYRTIESIQRYGEDLPRTVLTFDIVTGLTSSGGSLEDVEVAECGKAIIELLIDHETTEKEIKEGITDHKGGTVSKSLRLLCQEGKVQRQGLGKKGDPYLYVTVTRNAGDAGDKYIEIPTIPTIPKNNSSGELKDCPDCGRNEWTFTPDGKLICPCGYKGGES